MAVCARHRVVPVSLQRDAGQEYGDDAVYICDDDDGEDDLPCPPDPLKREDVKVEAQDRDLGEAERESVEQDRVPARLRMVSKSIVSPRLQDIGRTLTHATALSDRLKSQTWRPDPCITSAYTLSTSRSPREGKLTFEFTARRCC